MAKKAMILKQQRGSKFSTRRYNRCKICGRPTPTCVTTASAVYASASWPTRARSPELKRLRGEPIAPKPPEGLTARCAFRAGRSCPPIGAK